MLLHMILPALFGVAKASLFTPMMASDNINPKPVCKGNTTVSTCCINDWILLTPETVKYPGYSCGYKSTGTDGDHCIAPALPICCTETQGIITTITGDKNFYQPEDFRCQNLEGGLAE